MVRQARLEYAITPRFAPTSSPEQLRALGELADEHPDVLVQSHLAENDGECCWVADLFPDATDYTDVYDRAGLVHGRSLFAHAIPLSDQGVKTVRTRNAALAHCPTSNFFLNSGVFARDRYRGIKTGLGSDVGAGTSLCPWTTRSAACQVGRMTGSPPRPWASGNTSARSSRARTRIW